MKMVRSMLCSLRVIADTPADTTVFLYSRLNQLITIFRFNGHESPPNNPYSSSDPVSVHLDDDVFETVRRAPQINNIYMERLKYKEGPKTAEGPSSSYMTNNVQFHRVSILLSDLSIQQAVFYSFEVDEPDIPQTQIVIEPLSWDTIVYTRVTGIKSDDIVKDDDEFIVPDGPDDVSLHGGGASSKLLHRRTSSKSDHMPKHSRFDDIDMKSLYDALTSTDGASSNAEGESTEPVAIAHVLDQIGTLLNQDVPLEDVFAGTM
jgi:RNA polymerase I-specific transcription initiation factor RRN6